MTEPIQTIEPFSLLVQNAALMPEKHPNLSGEKLETQDEADRVHNKTRIEDGQVMIEQYDESGKLLKVTPPGYLPFGERA